MRSLIVRLPVLTAIILMMLLLFSCSKEDPGDDEFFSVNESESKGSKYIVVLEDEPENMDFQRTTIDYTLAVNVFDRLVEVKLNDDGRPVIMPSLARSWEVSEDGLVYTFHLRDGIRFSNGSALTSEDVEYTFRRLLTVSDACNQDIALPIEGAEELVAGKAKELKGFSIISDLDFSIRLKEPFYAFLSTLSAPGASILDEGTVSGAGDRFGMDPSCTFGTGPYIFSGYIKGSNMIFKANKGCWSGAPKNEGIELRFNDDPEDISQQFEEGNLDILDLDDLNNEAEYYINGDMFRDRLYKVPRVAIKYIALNGSVRPLNDVRVRRALQLALDRETLLNVIYRGNGRVENGIYPHGLYGYDQDLPEIPYDPDEAARLIAESGHADGLDITISIKASSSQWESELLSIVSSMWNKIGVNTTIEVLGDNEFLSRRKKGMLACYSAEWMADYDDPDGFIYPFFGGSDNTRSRSLCYHDSKIMGRVNDARKIRDNAKRISEYRKLEKIIVQDAAAWIPLFSRDYLYVTSERAGGFAPMWNGSVKGNYRDIYIKE